MTLRCISPYSAYYQWKPIAFQPGDMVTDAEMAAFVSADAPGSFEAVDVAVPGNEPAAKPDEGTDAGEGKAMEAPEVDKAMKPAKKKGSDNPGTMTKADHPGLLRG